MFWAKLFLRRVCYFIVFCLIWQYLLGRFFFFAYSYFILFLVDVLQSGIWRDANSLVDLSLRRLVPVGVQGSFLRAEIQIWLAEVA